MYKPLLGAALLLSAVTANAQMTNCNVFLKGAHLEVGINPSGAYGSSVPAPPGYHPRMAILGWPHVFYNPGCSAVADTVPNCLGFVADPGLSGWSNYYGDYYIPGTPQEGWAIQVNGAMQTSYTPSLMGTTPGATMPATLDVVPGANTGHTATGGHVYGTWMGMYDSIEIKQTTSLDTSGLYFKVDVQFTNLAIAPKNGIYYMRTIDPDNEHQITGNYNTVNTIEQQVTMSSDLVVVSAVGPTVAATYMALGTHDSRAKAFVIDFGLAPYNRMDSIYNETTNYSYSGSHSSDAGIGLIFDIGHLATVDSAGDSVSLARGAYKRPANSKTISFVYAFKSGVIDTMPSTMTNVGVSTVAGNNNSIKVMPNPVHNTALVSGLNTGDMISVYDLTGREVLRYDAGNNERVIANTEELAKGIYILVVKDLAGAVRNRVKIEKN